VAKAPVIDGRLDDEAWTKAEPIILVDTVTGKPVTKRTVAKMCWDDIHLYISFECEDEDIWGTFTKHDEWVFTEEVVEAFLCPTCDINRYFEINVSPRNVVFDGDLQLVNGQHPGVAAMMGWDCKDLRTAVVVDGTLDDRTDKDRGWTVEMAIPFESLRRQTPKPGERWRGNLYRIDLTPPPAEYQAWSPTFVTPASFHVSTRFGTIFFAE